MQLNDSVLDIKGVAENNSKKLNKLGIYTINDLLSYLPTRYVDFSTIREINQLKPGKQTVIVSFKSIKGNYLRRGMHITRAIAQDQTGTVNAVWFNQAYRANSIDKTKQYFLSGEFKLSGKYFSFTNPMIEEMNELPTHTAGIIPIYRQTEGFNSNQIRKIVKSVLSRIQINEIMPEDILRENQQISLKEAFMKIHFPDNQNDLILAKKRFNFNEIFKISLASRINKDELIKSDSHRISINIELIKSFVSKLPFTLTDDQRVAVWQIYKDLDKTHPMNRLVEGDVGSGKTVVAAMASIPPIEDGRQVALMAPTEILANQHANTFYELFAFLGIENKIALITSSKNTKNKKELAEKIRSNQAQMLIGTHALIEDYINPSHLSLIIIDEQHRFGVAQRKKLIKKSKYLPHLLSLSATPIPRSLALTMFNELDISLIKTMPNKSKIIHSKILSESQYLREIEKIKDLLNEGNQMYVVCPSISSEIMDSVDSVFDQIRERFKEYSVSKIHGKMTQSEKERIIKDFYAGSINILVSTTVIEVGIDVKKANIMIIMSPERFGLAQLHQLRGRVGRGEKPGFFYLVLKDNITANSRLKAIEDYTDGFKLAEMDLSLRGPGQIYGIFQHGELDERIFDLSDKDIIKKALMAVDYFIEKRYNLKDYSELNQTINQLRKITNLN